MNVRQTTIEASNSDGRPTRFNDTVEPMDLANMRQNGVRSLAVQCHQCLHEVIMNVDHLPGELTAPSFLSLIHISEPTRPY